MILIPDTRPEASHRIDTLPKVHRVKTHARFFDLVWALKKPVEIRLNDRDYRRADILHQFEYVMEGNHFDPHRRRDIVGRYTGRSIVAVIYQVMEDCPGLQPGHVLLILDLVSFNS